jgi:ribosomal protein S15P/S13E
VSILPDEVPPKPEHRNEDRPPLDLANVLRQVNAIQEHLKREKEKRQ